MNLLRTAVVVLCVMYGVVVVFNGFYVIPKLQEQVEANAQTTEAVCALRADLERRVATGTKFLAAHPDGVLGLTPREIRTSLENQQRTILALSGLECPKS
jgi:hypothetical protein